MAKASVQQRRAEIPSADHIARYCNPQRIIRDPKTNAIRGVFPEAFELRIINNELNLSVSWMEAFSTDSKAQFQGALVALRKKHLGVKNSGAFARLNAGQVVVAGSLRGHSVRVRDRSSATDLGYAEINGIPCDNSDKALLADFANMCRSEIKGVAEIDTFS